jgi:nitroreductase
MKPEQQNFFDVLRRQRACRAFSDERISDEDVALVLDGARFAPSAENSQPWVFVIVRDAVARAKIGDLIQRAWTRGGRTHESGKLPQALFQDVDQGAMGGIAAAPVLIVVGVDTTATFSTVLAASVLPAVQNLLLSATALGLGSALTTLALAHLGALREVVDLPDHIEPVAVIPLGRPAHPLGHPRRLPLERIAHRERYGTPW